MERNRIDKKILYMNIEDASESEASNSVSSAESRHRDMTGEALPALADRQKTVMVPVIQTMKDYILLHNRQGIAAELCRQIVEGEVATGYDTDNIRVIPLPKTCRFRHMTFWRASASSIIADIDVGIDLLLQDGVIDDTVKADFLVALHIDMDEGAILDFEVFGESDTKPDRDLWLLSDYLVPILRKDEIEAGAEALLEKYYPEALYDLKEHDGFKMAERMNLQVMRLPLYRRSRTKSILFFCEGEIAVCTSPGDPSGEAFEMVRVPGSTIVINTSVIPKDSCHLNIYHECIHFDWHYLFYRLQDMHNNDAKGFKTQRVAKTAKHRGENPLLLNLYIVRRADRSYSRRASFMSVSILAIKRVSLAVQSFRICSICFSNTPHKASRLSQKKSFSVIWSAFANFINAVRLALERAFSIWLKYWTERSAASANSSCAIPGRILAARTRFPAWASSAIFIFLLYNEVL